MRSRLRSWPALVLVLASVVLVGGQLPALAAGTAQATMPNPVPASTPQILDGTAADGSAYRVLDMKQVGNLIVVAGSFAQVQNPGTNGTIYNRSNVFAFNPATGLVDPGFAPVVNGQVNAVAAGPNNNTVYLGGQYNQVNGAGPPRLALVNLSNGARTAGFTTPAISSAVQDVVYSAATNRVFLAGTFTTVKAVAHGGLASLNATTGALDPYMSLDVAGHHNFGKHGTSSQAPTAVASIDVSPDGTRMIATGNFTTIEGVARDQVASILLPSTGAAVDTNWATTRYTPACKFQAFDSYIRKVEWAPDGSYFVIVATGAYFAGTLCDAAARFNASDTGTAVQPAWVSYTGGDSLWSVAVTGTAVYVGGHQRWGNNPLAGDRAGSGAVPRPGLTALDPLNGIPLSWNPGRNPRGIGAEALLATSTGLFVGMDTNWIGNFKYQRKKLAHFPLAGGSALPSQNTGSLPGTIYRGGTAPGVNNLLKRTYDGTTAGTDSAAPSTGGVNWANARGAFMAGNTLFYGYPDSTGLYELARQSFDGATFGPQQILNTPYKDPLWDGVATGSGTSTYDGVLPDFYGAELQSVVGMFYANGRLYYAKSGSSSLFYRPFSIDSGIVGTPAVSVSSSLFGSAGGMFLDGTNLYVANRTTGALSRVSFVNGVLGTTATVVSSADWRANALFIGPSGSAPANQPPTAAFTSSCSARTCTFDGTTSSDPDGDPLTYAWDFGDGSIGSGAQPPAHTYAADGTPTVTLTVTDGRGGSDSVSHQVSVAATAQGIAFRAAASASTPGGGTSISLTYPTVASGDGLVLILSNNSGTTTGGVTGTPPGFTQVGIQTAIASGTNPAMTTQVFQRVATGSESGTKLTVPLSAGAKSTLQLVAYSGTAAAGPVRSVASAADAGTQSTHKTPDTTANAGDWVVSVWSDKSTFVRSWTAPGGEATRASITSTGTNGEIAGLVGDAGAPVATTGAVAGLTATVPSGTPSSKATMFSIVLAAA